ncbi:T9SS type A sorting domain-containing protein [Portibacter marinus]|uniref:T9SS type A sorting domain-containing protein n=1 Tax=Portibacter marinus TaxID=2898660 RepID=UPI001F24AC95|nr:T9SS type A sorting domain-containing protein [Portibacter marinus]
MKKYKILIALLIPLLLNSQNIIQYDRVVKKQISAEGQDLPVIHSEDALNSAILATNGISEVTVLNNHDWRKIYSLIGRNVPEKENFVVYDDLFSHAKEMMDFEKVYPIMLMNYDFIYEGTDGKQSLDKTFASTILHNSVVGDQITYTINKDMLFSNNSNTYNIEVDFDNGEGYQDVFLNEGITIDYRGQRKEFLEIKLRTVDDEQTLYSHFTIRRKSSKIVPTVRNMGNFSTMRSVPPENHEFQFNASNGHSFTVTILYSDNIDGQRKLRRPFIVTDGFDPGNLRTYEGNNSSSNQDRVDHRGLFEFVNGDDSPWETEPSANFVDKLHSDGYDIVFVNFIQGAGDITTNGIAFKEFLNDVINGPTFRDSKTEMNIIVGPSMGGLITRYALASLEEDNIAHFTKSWIAFDSPMNGAYIPISLQYAVDFMHTWNFGISPAISSAKDKLDSYAALQLLIKHYDNFGEVIHNQFYSIMDDLDYPELLKRYAITNGGKSRLIGSTGTGNYENILFRLVNTLGPRMYGNSMHNTNSSTSYRLFRGEGNWGTTDKYVDYNIAYDGAVGGYNTALYAVNGDNAYNGWEKDPNNPANERYMKATFIPVASALGFEVTPSNVFDSWEDFSVNSSPFDEFFGMNTNEEHVNISQSTADDVIEDFFRPDFDNGQIPFDRNGNSDIVFDKPVAFTHRNTASFGGNGNTVEFQDGTDVNIKAGDWVRFESEVYIKSGAKININTAPINYSTVFRSSKARPGLDPFAKSDSRGKVYNYETADGLKNVNLITVTPNPAQNFIQVTNKTETQSRFRIMNTKGEEVKAVIISPNTNTRIDITDLLDGNYIIIDSNAARLGKFIKL